MIERIKRLLYFPVAGYFYFFAKIRLFFWSPRIIVVTGSSGKTTLLHLIESQLGPLAKYSHHANSSYGIPFDVLGLHRKNLTVIEWPLMFILAPLSIFKKFPKEKIYIVEADCDRPGEGLFLSSLLHPEVTLWVSVARTHSANFQNNKFNSIDEAIAYEFGYFVENTKSLIVTKSNNELISKQLSRARRSARIISLPDQIRKYRVNLIGTSFDFNNKSLKFPYLLPKEVGMSVLMCIELNKYLGIKSDMSFKKFKLPPGRSSFFEGVMGTTLIDSTYNSNLDSAKAILKMFGQIKSNNKWLILGDMLEQGVLEKEEHEKLADEISKYNFEKIILIGPRISKYTYPKLTSRLLKKDLTFAFLNPKEVLDYLKENIQGGEVLLFKGARFLEGVIENLLKHKEDSQYLARREKIWEIRRKKWGF